MKTLFTSDSHFGHENIIKYCNRPFKNTHEMDEAMITNWNSVVSDGDTVYHLGDFAFGSGVTIEYAHSCYKRLNGNIEFVEGNHEELLKKVLADRGQLGRLTKYREVKVQNQKIVLFHYGMRTWQHDLRGVWHLYGHSHAGLKPYGKSCDIGVDCWDFTPVSFEKLKLFMDNRPIGDHPEFSNFVAQSQT